MEEKGGDLESHGVVCEHDWKKNSEWQKIREQNNKFFFHWDVIKWRGVHKGY